MDGKAPFSIPTDLTPENSQEPKVWLPQFDQAAKLAATGIPIRQIAAKTGLPIATITRLRRSYRFVQLVRKYAIETTPSPSHSENDVDIARNLLEKASTKAASKLISMLDPALQDNPRNLRIQLEAAKDILDRVGIRPKLDVAATMSHVYSTEELAFVKDVLTEIQTLSENISQQGNPYVINVEHTKADNKP